MYLHVAVKKRYYYDHGHYLQKTSTFTYLDYSFNCHLMLIFFYFQSQLFSMDALWLKMMISFRKVKKLLLIRGRNGSSNILFNIVFKIFSKIEYLNYYNCPDLFVTLLFCCKTVVQVQEFLRYNFDCSDIFCNFITKKIIYYHHQKVELK